MAKHKSDNNALDPNSMSIKQFIDGILRDAVNASASDIHIEEDGHGLLGIRYRIDGILREYAIDQVFEALSLELQREGRTTENSILKLDGIQEDPNGFDLYAPGGGFTFYIHDEGENDQQPA